MTPFDDPETTVAAWLDEGPTDLPDATRRAILAALPTTPQIRRGLLAPWRSFEMIGFGRLAAVAIAAVVAGGLLFSLLPAPGPGTPVPTRGPDAQSAQPTGTPVATPASTFTTTTFTSETYGFTVEVPDGWATRQAEGEWTGWLPVDGDSAHADRFKPRNSPAANVAIAAQPLPEGLTAGAWLAEWAERRAAAGGSCSGPGTEWTDATVAGVPARRFEVDCDVLQPGVPVAMLELAWVRDGTVFVITGTSPSVVAFMADSVRAE